MSQEPKTNSNLQGVDNDNNNNKVLALFDLDHTLLDVDSDYLWGEYIVKHGLVDEVEYRTANKKFYEQYIEGTLDATEYNEFVATFLSSLPIERLDVLREDYIKYDIEPHIRPKGLKTMRRHIEAGHDVVIISATNNFVVDRIAACFGIEQAYVLATPLEIKDNRYTGKLMDRPNFQEGKLYHLQNWLTKQKKAGIEYDFTYAYSDSKNDLPLLDWSDKPVAVTPDDTLRTHALTQQWAVEDWSI